MNRNSKESIERDLGRIDALEDAAQDGRLTDTFCLLDAWLEELKNLDPDPIEPTNITLGVRSDEHGSEIEFTFHETQESLNEKLQEVMKSDAVVQSNYLVTLVVTPKTLNEEEDD